MSNLGVAFPYNNIIEIYNPTFNQIKKILKIRSDYT